MRRSIVCLIGLLLVALLLAACAAPQAGPMVWVDRPLDGSILPLAPVTLLAHASDEDLVASFEFYVDGTLLARVPSGPPARHPGPYATSPGASRSASYLGDATVGWNPTEPGVYTITVRAIDSRGNVGAEAISVVTVGQLPTPSLPALVAPPEEGEIIFLVEPEAIPVGECAMLRWEVVPPAEALLDGEGVPPTGEREVCPETTTVYELLVPEWDQVRMVTLRVEAEPEFTPSPQPTAPPPTGTPRPTATQPPPTATQPPSTPAPPPPAPRIVSFQANPSTIVAGQCSTLSWAVEDALTGVWLNGERVGDHDATDTCPPRSTTYTLVARSPGGEDTRSVTVTVIQPSPTQPPPFAADLAITDIYPQTLNGPVWVRITNRGGPGTVNDTVQLSCQWTERDPIEGITRSGQQGPMPIPISNLGPNQTQEFNTDIPLVAGYQYNMTCSIQVPFNDPNPGNNSYSEQW
jgi:hypothetical protein